MILELFTIWDNCYYEKIGNQVKNIDNNIPFDSDKDVLWIRLKDICIEIFAGGDRPKNWSKEKTIDNTVPIYSNGLDNDGLYGYTNEAKVKQKAITISARGTIGNSIIRKEPFVPIVRLITIIPSRFIDIAYLKIVLNALMETGGGSSTLQLTVPTIKEKLIPIYSLSKQKQIAKIVDSSLLLIDKIQQDNKSIIHLVSTCKQRIIDEVFGEDSSYKSYYENYVSISNLFYTISTVGKEVKTQETLNEGRYPVVSQSKNLIDGYYDNEKKLIIDYPVIVFGDHTKNIKYINFQFVPGADGTKILKPKVNQKYLYYCSLYASSQIEDRGYNRHFSLFKKYPVPNIKSIEKQKEIADKLDVMFNYLDNILD